MEGRSTKNPNKKINNKGKMFGFLANLYETILGHNNKIQAIKSLEKLLVNCSKRGFISGEEQKMISNIINIDDTKVSDVMIPRADIIAISNNASLKVAQDIIIEQEHTRIPVYGENLDEVTGFIHSKDLVKYLSKEDDEVKIENLIRKIIYVPHSMRIIDLLRKMRSSRVHIAIVLDEYGGTDGLITIEDIMEEIIGEIEDEHDSPNNNIYNTIKKINDKTFNVGGRVEIKEVEELLKRKIVKENEYYDFETIGGFILSQLKKIPKIGEVIKAKHNLYFKILDADLRSIKLIEITQHKNRKKK